MREKKGRRTGVGAQERERRRMRVERESEEKTKKRKRKRKNEETDGRNRIASPDLEFNSHANHNEAAINTQKSSQHFTATETIKSTILICNVHLPSLYTTIHTVFLSLWSLRVSQSQTLTPQGSGCELNS